MFAIWAHNYLSDVAGKGRLWRTNSTCQQHTLISLSHEVCWFVKEDFFSCGSLVSLLALLTRNYSYIQQIRQNCGRAGNKSITAQPQSPARMI